MILTSMIFVMMKMKKIKLFIFSLMTILLLLSTSKGALGHKVVDVSNKEKKCITTVSQESKDTSLSSNKPVTIVSNQRVNQTTSYVVAIGDSATMSHIDSSLSVIATSAKTMLTLQNYRDFQKRELNKFSLYIWFTAFLLSFIALFATRNSPLFQKIATYLCIIFCTLFVLKLPMFLIFL